MFKFLIGVVLGYIVARMLRHEYVDTKMIEASFSDLQKRAESVLTESRRILEETRHELSAALEASRSSVQDKAERIRTAAIEPEYKAEQKTSHNRGSEITELPRPSKIE